jgi:hypothetical protein
METQISAAEENAAAVVKLTELQQVLNEEGIGIQNYDIQMLNLRLSCLVELLVKTFGLDREELDAACNRTQIAGIEAVIAQHRYQKTIAKLALPVQPPVKHLQIVRR